MTSDSPSLSAIYEGRAAALLAEGNVDEAMRVASEAVEAARAAEEQDPKLRPLLVQALENLAEIKREAGHLDKALTLYQESLALALDEKMDPEVLGQIRTSMAVLLDNAGREDEAAPVYEEAVKNLSATSSPDLVTVGQLRNNLAMIYKRQGRFALAEQHYLASIEALEATLGRETEMVSSIYNNLGGLYYAAGFPDQAREMFLEAMEIRLRLLGPEHPDVAQSHCNLATVYYELHDNAAAQKSYEESLRILEVHLPDEAASFEAVGLDYASMLAAIHEEDKAAQVEARVKEVLAKLAA